MHIDLTQYVILRASRGPWLKAPDDFTSSELRLGDPADLVTLAGPLRVRVSVQARNFFSILGATEVAVQARDIYSYTLDIPPGQTWSYPAPRALEGLISKPAVTTGPSLTPQPPLLDPTGAQLPGVTAPAPPANDRLVHAVTHLEREPWLGANAGFGIVIRPAGSDQCADPCAPDPCRPVDPCAPKKKECHCGGGCGCGGDSSCGCGCEGHSDDLPCDFATGRGSHIGRFFPAACEPCTPGAFVGMPPMKGPSLVVGAARGGTVRTRYFNGMFITKEDLWTDQNNNRIKHALMNRAMGQGVVWGFDVCLDGDAVCVLPGYGVDCCGNDIVISSPYRVDSHALLRDPAAAATLGKARSHRMNLLLEYFECPEEPRPVHGDPCAPDQVSCEMSRIRETARLRLIPPCDVDDSGPIKDFLEEVRKLRGDPALGPLFPPPPAVGGPPPAPTGPTITTTTVDASTVPFQIVIQSRLGGAATSITIDPKIGASSHSIQSDMSQLVIGVVQAQAGATFTSGMVSELAPNAAGIVAVSASTTNWKVGIVTVSAPIQDVVDNWVIEQGNTVFKGRTHLGFTRRREGNASTVQIDVRHEAAGTKTVVVHPPPVQQPPSPFPCSAEACDPEGRPRFPVPIPWLHADPSRPDEAADPKVIMLALLYTLVVSKMTQAPVNDAQVQKEMESLGAALQLTAWKLFYDNVPEPKRGELMEALRRLLQAWCKGLLYSGPRCECGCEPHGVVVGCAVVEGGTIRMVDPWGGRRWVVHYPLVAYWGKQFGIQPFDAIASKFFDMLCCVAHLYPSAQGTQQLQPGVIFRGLNIGDVKTPIVSFGASALILDSPEKLPGRLAELGVAPERRVTLSPAEFVARVAQGLNAPGAGGAPGGESILYSVAGLLDLNFLERGAGVAAVAEPPSFRNAEQPARSSRLSTVVRSAIDARPRADAIPPLLRGASEAVTRELLDAIAPEPATDAGRDVREALDGAGITSVAGVLDANPEELHANVLAGRNAAGLADLLEVSEQTVDATVKAVGDTVVALARKGRLVSRDDLRDPPKARALAEALGKALPATMTTKAVSAAVERAGDGA
jgi:hypothetical protein